MKVRVLLVLVVLLCGCSGSPEGDRTTDTYSADLSSNVEKVKFLRRYVELKSAVLQTEFHIIYHDNSGGLLSGPSDWDIQAVMAVEDVAPWIEGKTVVDSADFAWAEALLTEELRPASQPTYYTNQTTTIAVFEPEQIIFLYSITTP